MFRTSGGVFCYGYRSVALCPVLLYKYWFGILENELSCLWVWLYSIIRICGLKVRAKFFSSKEARCMVIIPTYDRRVSLETYV